MCIRDSQIPAGPGALRRGPGPGPAAGPWAGAGVPPAGCCRILRGHPCHDGGADAAANPGPPGKPEMGHRKRAVSYTHLDVYKRQV